MKSYLVGGAVRDELLGKAIKEKDFVVIGETKESMLERGFKQVGKDFPVFLHPETQEEYALARTERKTDKGYYGFSLDASPNVTLEEDLLRRDLTINAMAKDSTGHITDPYHGQQDLKNKILKHVSDAFVEDPLRIFRVARFQAYLPDFSIAEDTLTLMQQLANKPGELHALPKERIWIEIEKAATHPRFDLFWEILDQVGALQILGIKLSPSFTHHIKTSTLRQTHRLLSTLWSDPLPQNLETLILPHNLLSAYKVITHNAHLILNPQQLNAEDTLSAIIHLDPFRRQERAEMILQSLPDQNIAHYWLTLIEKLLAIDIQATIKTSDNIPNAIKSARLAVIHKHQTTY